MPEFAPDDDPDDAEDEQQVHTDRVSVDPSLFGELPDKPIEVVDDDGNGLISGQTQHEWEREATIVELIGVCPYCDGPTETREMTSPTGDMIYKRTCTDCGEQWTTNADKGFTGPV
jgi:hypothetical protein